ncbi:hypothetical protein OE88DRAFT_1667747 [Heliocybe sulcata]|uniref:Uncharacterized protein n=1 Tax=Heliocybe sulcata TaxID=5364 RepID=A0A5C3MPV0_9AGAM|nr:hypothetical protein OE88DRAFT_1667747 [Heliocybe sulcata]
MRRAVEPVTAVGPSRTRSPTSSAGLLNSVAGLAMGSVGNSMRTRVLIPDLQKPDHSGAIWRLADKMVQIIVYRTPGSHDRVAVTPAGPVNQSSESPVSTGPSIPKTCSQAVRMPQSAVFWNRCLPAHWPSAIGVCKVLGAVLKLQPEYMTRPSDRAK